MLAAKSWVKHRSEFTSNGRGCRTRSCSTCREIAGKAQESALPPVIAWGEAGFAAEELREMAGIGVADVKRDVHDALIRFAEQAFCLIHPQIDVIARRRRARGALEQAIKVKLAQPNLSRQPIKVELFGEVFGHPV